MPFRISYNAPFTLTFSFLCIAVLLADAFTGNAFKTHLFSIHPQLSWTHPLTYIRLFLHIFGHADPQHLFSNLTMILLVGPILEEKYGVKPLLFLTLLTALTTGLIAVFLGIALIGASGVAFLLIILSSFTASSRDGIPLTFILVAFLFLGNEILGSFQKDAVAQFAHLIGGAYGAAWGLTRPR